MRNPWSTIVALAVLSTPSVPARLESQAAERGGVRLAVLTQQARVRTALDAEMSPERQVAQLGAEVSLPTFWPALRVTGQFLQSTLGSTDLRSQAIGVAVSIGSVGITAALAQRGGYSPQSGLAHGRTSHFARAGLRTRIGLGASGLSLHLQGDAFIPTEQVENESDAVAGWDTASGVTFEPRTIPIAATLGYRLERFRVFGAEQEVSAVTFALAYTIGRR